MISGNKIDQKKIQADLLTPRKNQFLSSYLKNVLFFISLLCFAKASLSIEILSLSRFKTLQIKI